MRGNPPKRKTALNGQIIQMDYDGGADFNESFEDLFEYLTDEITSSIPEQVELEMWANVNVMVALPNIGGALYSTP